MLTTINSPTNPDEGQRSMLNCTCDKGEIIIVKDDEEDINAVPQVVSTIFVLYVTSLMQGEGVGKESCKNCIICVRIL